MRKGKRIRRILAGLGLAILAFAIYYAWFSFPIISGFDAKNACSCLYVGRQPEDSIRKELSVLPFSLARLSFNRDDSTVTASILGWAKRKAIFRPGLGCTLVNGVTEQTLRRRKSGPALQPVPDTALWLGGQPVSDSLPGTWDGGRLQHAIGEELRGPGSEKRMTRAVLVVYKGRIVGEEYSPGFSDTSLLLGWSMAKSITGALIGILVGEGRLQLEGPAPVPEWRSVDDGRRDITLEHLLQQRSGLDFREVYHSYSDANNMLFNEGNMAAYTASLHMKHPAGTKFYYSSGNTNILARIIRQTVGDSAYPAFLYRAFFHRIGMHHTLMEPDASGTIVGSSYVWATARDYARFGQLYLQDGVWNGKRILPEGWVPRSVTAPPTDPLKHYGFQFWLNGMNERHPDQRDFPEVPEDLFYADGYGGQRIFILPSRSLVVVRLGHRMFDERTFLHNILSAFPAR